MPGNTETDFVEARKRAIERLVRSGYVKSHEVRRAMLTVPREEFLPLSLKERAYVDTPLPIGYGQTISALHMVAMMAEALSLEKRQRILEVGCGSGYHAAVISEIVADRTEKKGHVYSIEIVSELFSFARDNLRKTHYDEVVTAIHGDGSLGYPDGAPYDRVFVAAAAPSIPRPLIEQLKDGGLLVIPVGNLHFFQELLRVKKVGDRLIEQNLGGVAFVPLRGEYGWKISR